MEVLLITKKRIATVLCLTLLASIAGCGKNQKMGGTVTYSDDGSPVTTGTVCFTTDSFYARGKLDDQGRYQLGTESVGNGIPKGNYKVSIANSQKVTGSKSVPGGSSMPILEETIAPKFRAAGTTDITCTVDGSTRQFDFKVDRP